MFIHPDANVETSIGSIRKAETGSTRAQIKHKYAVEMNAAIIACTPKPTLFSSMRTRCHSSVNAFWIKNARITL